MVKTMRLKDAGEGLRAAITQLRFGTAQPSRDGCVFLTYGRIAALTGVKAHQVRAICQAMLHPQQGRAPGKPGPASKYNEAHLGYIFSDITLEQQKELSLAHRCHIFGRMFGPITLSPSYLRHLYCSRGIRYKATYSTYALTPK